MTSGAMFYLYMCARVRVAISMPTCVRLCHAIVVPICGSIGIHKHTHSSLVKHKLDPMAALGHPCNTHANMEPCVLPVDNLCITYVQPLWILWITYV